MRQPRSFGLYAPLLPAPTARAVCRSANAARKRRTRGSALITAIVFALIVALTLAGVSLLTVQHYSLAHVEADSTSAMDLAEAGINYELTRITNNTADADQPNGQYQSATNIDATLRGSFYVRCIDPVSGGTWNGKDKVTIVSTGIINGARRTVSIDAAPSGTFYTAYAAGTSTTGGRLSFQGEGDTLNGLAGTDGKLYINPNVNTKPAITGVVFNGPNAGFSNGQSTSGYPSTINPKIVPWTPVSQILNQDFPNGAVGLAANNDNALATYEDGTPAIVSNQLANNGSDPSHLVVTMKGKPPVNGVAQPTNYYLTTLDLTGNTDLVFDNTNGPINVYYIAPKDADSNSTTQGANLRGGHTVKSLLDAPGHNVNLYSSSPGNMVLTADTNPAPVELGIYAYDTTTAPDGSTQAFGGVNIGDNFNLKGQIIANKLNIYNNVNITGQRGYFDLPDEYYAFSGNWREWAGDGSSGVYGGGNQ